jgi:hypothetical protein
MLSSHLNNGGIAFFQTGRIYLVTEKLLWLSGKVMD